MPCECSLDPRAEWADGKELLLMRPTVLKMKAPISMSTLRKFPFQRLVGHIWLRAVKRLALAAKVCPGPEDVLIKLNATGLCLSDIHFMSNDWAVPKMSDLGTKCAGHEGAGVIVKVGERVKNLKIGMRAGYKPLQDTCHTCEYCKAGRETYCQKAVLTGCQIDGE